MTAQQSLSYEFDQRVPPHTDLVELATGRAERLFEGHGLLPKEVQCTPDSSGFFFTDEHTRHPTYGMATITEIHYCDLASRRAEKIDLGWERVLGGSSSPTPDGFIALFADGVRYRPARYSREVEGWRRHDLAGEHVRNIDDWVLSRDGTTLPELAYVGFRVVLDRSE